MPTLRGERAIILAAIALMATVAFTNDAVAAGDPIVDAQQLVYEINLARWNPVAFAERSQVTTFPSGILARPPVAIDPSLGGSAMYKANEMADNGYFAHQSEVTGVWPNRLARDHGFALPSWWMSDANYIESLFAGSPEPFVALKAFAGSASHRVHIFGEGSFDSGGFADYNEIGVGRSTNQDYWTVHLTLADGPRPVFVTGVVYDDANDNGRMDLGEGIGGVQVAAGAGSATTNSGGGYAVQVAPGDHLVTASGYSGTVVTVTGQNVGVDFVAGDSSPIVRSYELCQGLQPTILGTSRDDVLTATAGRDIIHGLGGNDTIIGLGADDVVCGVDSSGSNEASSGTVPSGGDTVVAVGADGRWHRRDTLAASSPVEGFYYGNPGDIPFTGDWDGDGVATPGLFRQRDGYVYLRNSNTQGVADITFFFGNPGDVPVVGDFNGDGRDTVSIYRPSLGRFYIINQLGQNGGGLGTADFWFDFGNPGDRPFVGDFDGDGIDTVGLYRATTGYVYLRNALSDGTAHAQFYFGNPGDIIFAGDWDGDGDDTVAVYRPSSGRIYFRLMNSSGPADYTLTVGVYTGAAPA